MGMETIDIDQTVRNFIQNKAYTLNKSNIVFQVERVEIFSLEVDISEPRL